VGESVRSKQFGTVWKVIEQKEIWIEESVKPGDSGKPEPFTLIPAIYLRYWREATSQGPGRGKTKSYSYMPDDPSFTEHWEVLYDW
jgi:hypothetical protein